MWHVVLELPQQHSTAALDVSGQYLFWWTCLHSVPGEVAEFNPKGLAQSF